MPPPKNPASKTDTGANLGFEAKLWQMADGLRNNMDAAEYKHVVLGLIFLKYISDAFEAKHAELETQRKKGADPEDPDEYKAASRKTRSRSNQDRAGGAWVGVFR
jgi:type I restriction enzyme M protein